MPRKHPITIYNSLVYPYLLCGITIWGGTYGKYLNSIIITRKKMMRNICNVPYLTHSEPLFKQLKIFTTSRETHGHATRHSISYKLIMSKIRSNTGCRSILKKGPVFWNMLPSELYTRTIATEEVLVSNTCFSSRFKRLSTCADCRLPGSGAGADFSCLCHQMVFCWGGGGGGGIFHFFLCLCTAQLAFYFIVFILIKAAENLIEIIYAYTIVINYSLLYLRYTVKLTLFSALNNNSNVFSLVYICLTCIDICICVYACNDRTMYIYLYGPQWWG